MSDRLKELQRQRALVQEHLNWLDREITAQGGIAQQPTEKVSPLIAKQILAHAALNPAPLAPTKSTGDASAEDILAQYKNDPRSLHTDVKKGCFLYFSLAMALLALGVVALYFLRSRP